MGVAVALAVANLAFTVVVAAGVGVWELRKWRATQAEEAEANQAEADRIARLVAVGDVRQLDRIAGARLMAVTVETDSVTLGFGFPTDEGGAWRVSRAAELTIPRDADRPIQFWTEMP